MPELRIGLLTHSVNPRGGVVHTLSLADALHDRGHRVTVFAPALPGQAMFRRPRCKVELVPIDPAPVGPSANGLAAMITTRRAAFVRHLTRRFDRRPDLHPTGPSATDRFDVLHAQDGIGANALADLCDAGLIDGFVRTVHHLDDFVDPQVMAWQSRAFLRARQVLCVSQVWCDTLLREHGVRAVRVDNGVDLGRFSPMPTMADAAVVARHGLRPGGPMFLAVGGVEERKNTLRILEAFIAFHRTRPTAQLVIAGGASLLDHEAYGHAFRSTLQASGLSHGQGRAVVVTGTVPDDAMPALFRAADTLLMPSIYEGFGLVVLEALASGTPAVVSRIAPFTDYLQVDESVDHVCWADPMSVESITQAMQRAIDPAHAQVLARVPSAVCTRFDWAASARHHEQIYLTHRAHPAKAPRLDRRVPH